MRENHKKMGESPPIAGVDILDEDFKRIQGGIINLYNFKQEDVTRAMLFFRNLKLGRKFDREEHDRCLARLRVVRDIGNEIKVFTEKIIREGEKLK